MSRIRSIHPGLFTDEAFVSVSMAARVLFPGIWTEADDHGVFEWKPLTLKMKVFPADNMDVEPLLAELISSEMVKKFTVEGKDYGLVRNFAKYQRPKKPAYRFPLPDELRTYVGIRVPSSEPVPHSAPTSTEIPPQMEDGGDNRREVESKKDSSLRSEGEPTKKSRRKPQVALPSDWKPSNDLENSAAEMGLKPGEIVREVVRFRNHAAQSDRRCADWDAAFRNWCLKAAEIAGKPLESEANGEVRDIFIPQESPKWGQLCARWRETNRKNTGPPAFDHRGVVGWYFPKEWAGA